MNNKNIDKAIKILRTFQGIDEHMSVSCALAVLLASKTTKQREVETLLGLSNAAASRNVTYWTKRFKKDVEGKDFINTYPDPDDYRMKRVEIRPKGNVLFNNINDILEE